MINERLRKAIKKNGYTQKELADQMEICTNSFVKKIGHYDGYHFTKCEKFFLSGVLIGIGEDEIE